MVAMTHEIALLAPVPVEHLVDGEEVGRREGKVAFGSRAWELFRQLDAIRSGAMADVYIYPSHLHQPPHFDVRWRACYIGRVEAVGGAHPPGMRYRPSSTAKYSNDNHGHWAVFWEVQELREMAKAERISTGHRQGFKRTPYLNDDEESRLRSDRRRGVAPGSLRPQSRFRRANEFRCRWVDVNFEAGTICARKPKGKEDYFVPINDGLRAILQGLPSRLGSEWVFPSSTGKTPMTRRTGCTASSCRRSRRRRSRTSTGTTCGTPSQADWSWVDLRTVQELLGHKSLAMAPRYAHLSPAHKLEAVQRLSRDPTGTTTSIEVAATKKAAGGGGQVVVTNGNE